VLDCRKTIKVKIQRLTMKETSQNTTHVVFINNNPQIKLHYKSKGVPQTAEVAENSDKEPSHVIKSRQITSRATRWSVKPVQLPTSNRKSKRRFTNIHEIGYPCHVCSLEFNKLTDLQQHLVAHATFTCDFCGKQFDEKPLLQQHQESCHYYSDRLLESSAAEENCNKSTPLRAFSKKKAFTCKLCNKKYVDIPGLYMHKRMHQAQYVL